MSMMSRLEVKRKQLYHASYFNETVIGDVNSRADLTTQYLFQGFGLHQWAFACRIVINNNSLTNLGGGGGGGGGGALPYKGLMGMCSPTGYGFQDFLS